MLLDESLLPEPPLPLAPSAESDDSLSLPSLSL
jgi:hypothetical protein